MADGTHWKELMEAQKQFDRTLQNETMKQEASESKVEKLFIGLNDKLDHINKMADAILLQLAMNKRKESGENFCVVEAQSQHQITTRFKAKNQSLPSSSVPEKLFATTQIDAPSANSLSIPVTELDRPQTQFLPLEHNSKVVSALMFDYEGLDEFEGILLCELFTKSTIASESDSVPCSEDSVKDPKLGVKVLRIMLNEVEGMLKIMVYNVNIDLGLLSNKWSAIVGIKFVMNYSKKGHYSVGCSSFSELLNVKVLNSREWMLCLESNCVSLCVRNCTFLAYTYDPGINYMFVSGNLVSVQNFVCVCAVYAFKKQATVVGNLSMIQDISDENIVASYVFKPIFVCNLAISRLVWMKYMHKWNSLENFLDGEKGSGIPRTTRSQSIARMRGKTQWISLRLLSNLECDKIWNRVTRGIGIEVMKKCHELSLSVRFVGSVLALKSGEVKWIAILESQLWKYEDNGIKKYYFELLDLKDAVNNLCSNTRTKYLAFSKSSDEKLGLEMKIVGVIEMVETSTESGGVHDGLILQVILMKCFPDTEKMKGNSVVLLEIETMTAQFRASPKLLDGKKLVVVSSLQDNDPDFNEEMADYLALKEDFSCTSKSGHIRDLINLYEHDKAAVVIKDKEECLELVDHRKCADFAKSDNNGLDDEIDKKSELIKVLRTATYANLNLVFGYIGLNQWGDLAELFELLILKPNDPSFPLKVELSSGQIGWTMMTMLGVGKMKHDIYDKVAERFSSDSTGEPFLKYSKGLIAMIYYGGNIYIDDLKFLCQERSRAIFNLDGDALDCIKCRINLPPKPPPQVQYMSLGDKTLSRGEYCHEHEEWMSAMNTMSFEVEDHESFNGLDEVAGEGISQFIIIKLFYDFICIRAIL